MGFNVPLLNRDSEWVYSHVHEWTKTNQKKLVLVIVSIALLLDNMLYMVIVPIIPKYLRDIHAYETTYVGGQNITETLDDGTHVIRTEGGHWEYIDEELELGWLFASKALLQIFVNPLSGFIIDRIGYEVPMVIGLVVMFSSTAIFALGQTYGVLFFARSLQGFGSAFADTSGLAMIADRFSEDGERSAALGIALAFISFGCLVAPPFGSVLYAAAGKPVPFLILAFVCLSDALAVFMVIQPRPQGAGKRDEQGDRIQGTPMWRLFMDPFIAVCSGALIMANVSLAFLEPTITTWMSSTMPGTPGWMVGMIWLPAFFPHVLGVYVTVKLLKRFPRHTWAIAIVGLLMEGLACISVPFMTSVLQLIIPLSFVCFGIALIDTSLLPMLAHLVDTRHVSVYGSVYAIADISYSLAYAFGPIIAGWLVSTFSFLVMNMIIAVLNVGYSPVIFMLRKVDGYANIDKQEEEGVDGATQLRENPQDNRRNEYGTIDATDAAYPTTAFNNGFQQQQGYQTGYQADPFSAHNHNQPQPEFPPGYDPLNPSW